ncbi:MAG: IS1634 family transposase [Rhodocyclaceae bacterium]|nr:IS1634 family transposase [Rhodocyclaceae bacterium]
MSARQGPVHVATTRRTYGDKTYRTHLLRRTYREDGKVKNETVGNLSHLPDPVIELIRRALRGETLVNPAEGFEVLASRMHGDGAAVLRAIHRLKLRELFGARRNRQADLVIGMIAARVLAPHTKLATTRWWQTRTLAEDLGIGDATEDELYAAMDWLLERQGAVEHKLAARHLDEGALALYDLSSSYFEGTQCTLAKIGYSRDGKRNKPQVNYGLLADRRGCPVAVSVYAGNVGDAKTLLPQVEKLKEDFGLNEVVLVGDRGMIGQAHIETLRQRTGLSWITALKSGQIRALVKGEALQLGLFDERNLFELAHPDYPGERLVACRNPELARLRAHKRAALLCATEAELDKVRAMVERGSLAGAAKIGVRVGRVLNKYKVAKHFVLTIEDTRFAWQRDSSSIETEAALDGVYVIRTAVAAEVMNAPQVVRHYKGLAEVERAFRSLKTVDLKIRPIHHRLEHRVRAHIFLCMLAYYVEWHLRQVWRELLFADEEQAAKAERDPVAPARRSVSADQKASGHTLADGSPVHSLRTLFDELATQVRNTCRTRVASDAPTFQLITQPSPTQRRALALVETISP